MTSRRRTYDARIEVNGTYQAPTGQIFGCTAWRGLTGICDDTEGQFDQNNLFDMEHSECYFPTLDGVEYRSDGTVLRKFVNYPIGFRPSPPTIASKFPLPSPTDQLNFAATTAARTNVSTPVVDVPTNIGELRDLPMLVKDWGGNLLRKVAKGNISWQFALRPMISDAMKLFQFAETAYKRFLYLNRLLSGKFVKRRCRLGESVATTEAVSRTTVHSEGAIVTAYRDLFYAYEAWSTIRWKAYGLQFMPKDISSQYDLSKRLYYGITCYNALRTAWELTPWSWLVDWFFDIGTWINANNNTVPVEPSNYCYMRKSTSWSVYREAVKPSWVTLSGVYQEREVIKYRVCPTLVITTPPFPTLPALSGRQWSILGSLAALKALLR